MLFYSDSTQLKESGKSVLSAWLSPSDAFWSRGKAHGCLMNEDKLELCQLAVRDHPFIRVSSWEITRGNPVDFGGVLEHVRSIVPAWVDVLYVCGADHAVKCNLYRKKSVVIVARVGSRIPDGKAIVVEGGDSDADASSTAVRKAVEDGNLESVKNLLHPAVFERLKERGKELFSS